MKAVATDPGEVQCLREHLVKTQENTAEVPMLRESLKNSIPVAQLVAKLSARDVKHKRAVKDLLERARMAESLQEEVNRLQEEVSRLRAMEEWLKASH